MFEIALSGREGAEGVKNIGRTRRGLRKQRRCR